MSFHRLRSAQFLLLSIFSSSLPLSFLSAAGDAVVFLNGDRLSGTITSETEQTIEFYSVTLGQLVLPKKQIAEIERAPAHPSTILESTALEDPTPAEEAGEAGEAGDFLARSGRMAADMLRPYSPFGWSGKIELGIGLTRATSSSDAIRASLDAEKVIGQNEYSTGLYYDFQSTEAADGTESVDTDRYGGYFGYTRVLPYNFTLTGDTRLFSNRIQAIDLQYDASLLLGRRFEIFETGRLELNVGRTASYLDPSEGDSECSFLWEFRQSLKLDPLESLSVSEALRYQIDPEDTDRDALIFELILTYRFSERLNSVLRYEYEASNLAQSGDQEEEQRFSLSLAIPF